MRISRHKGPRSTRAGVEGAARWALRVGVVALGLVVLPAVVVAQDLACCHYDAATPRCEDLSLLELDTCVTAGGDPFPLTTCGALTCPALPADKFACCLPGGDECVDVIGVEACYDTLGGTPFASDTCTLVDCGELPRSGVCCTPDESCTETLDIACDDYFIEGSTCEPDACEPIRGACCTALGCEQLSQEICEDAGGTFHGMGEACDPLLCERACCISGGECLVDSDLVCDLRVGTPVESLTCDVDTCDTVATACCLPSDAGTGCLDIDPLTCADAGGASYGSLLCDELTCPDLGPGTTACCTSGMCTDATSLECVEGGGQVLNGISCRNLGACPPPELGACCVDSPFPICSDRASEASCEDRGGAWYRETPCAELDASTCNVVSGACCNAGLCTETFEPAVCEAGGGRFLAGATCDTIDCSQGACCLGEFGCASGLYRDQCEGFDGSFFESVRCRDIECESACCDDGGGCANLLADTCEAGGGVSVGRGVLCDYVNACPAPEPDTVACCEREMCSDVPAGACDGRVYHGLDCDDFSDGLCPYTERGACCLDQDVCADLSVATSCDAIGGSFYPGIDCDTANATVCHPQPFYACCVDGVCQEATDRFCDGLGGELFDGQACDEVVCPVPADPDPDPDAGDTSDTQPTDATGDSSDTDPSDTTTDTDDATADADPDAMDPDAETGTDDTTTDGSGDPLADTETPPGPGAYHGGALLGCVSAPQRSGPWWLIALGALLWTRRRREQ